jgi:copper chaperone NosL
MKNLSLKHRLIIAVSALAMLGSYFFPLWRIDLWAPQYPEGLSMYIWHNRLGGDVEIINGLNHYIGMAHLKQESFPEFGILPYLIAGFIGLGLLVALLGKRRWLTVYLSLMIVAGIVALADFYRWGYTYGHNLDPNAAIKVPGMSYQPPVIGYKELLNFGAYSIPDLGGWIFIGAGLVMAAVWAYGFYQFRKGATKLSKPIKTLAQLILAAGFMACSSNPEPIQYGHDACHFCKMTIMDNKFGCEIMTTKGKAFKFDDLNCMVRYVKENAFDEKEAAHIVVNDFTNGGQFVAVKNAIFLKSAQFKSPMRGDIAAFPSQELADKNRPANAAVLRWEDVKKAF